MICNGLTWWCLKIIQLIMSLFYLTGWPSYCPVFRNAQYQRSNIWEQEEAWRYWRRLSDSGRWYFLISCKRFQISVVFVALSMFCSIKQEQDNKQRRHLSFSLSLREAAPKTTFSTERCRAWSATSTWLCLMHTFMNRYEFVSLYWYKLIFCRNRLKTTWNVTKSGVHLCVL